MNLTTQTQNNAPQIVGQDAIAARLAEYVVKAGKAYSPATMRAIKSDTALFYEWCNDAGHSAALPAAPATVAAFVAAMSETRKPASVSRYIASIDHLHRAAGLLPVGPSSDVRLALRTMRREKGTAQDQAKPMRLSDIERALIGMGDSPLDLRDAALIALAYDTLCRASELVALTVGDVQADGVYIARSKTDQDGAGAVAYISPKTFERVQAWADCYRLEADTPLFIPLGNRATGDALTAGEVTRIYKRRVGVAFSAHSTRVGAAVEMREAGLSTGDIAHAGRWSGDAMPQRYTRRAAAKLGGAARLASLQGRA